MTNSDIHRLAYIRYSLFLAMACLLPCLAFANPNDATKPASDGHDVSGMQPALTSSSGGRKVSSECGDGGCIMFLQNATSAEKREILRRKNISNLRFSGNGTLIFFSDDTDHPTDYYVKVGGPYVAHPVNPTATIVGIGDSLTVGTGGATSYLSQLSRMLNNRAIVNAGVGGQTSTNIAARIGAEPISILFPDNVIPSSGSATVTVDKTPITDQGPPRVLGEIDGIVGYLERSSLTHSLSFVRAVPGDAHKMNGAGMFVANAQGLDLGIAIIQVGRNNFRYPKDVLHDVDRIVAWLKPLNKKFIINSVIKGSGTQENSGKKDANFIDEINRQLEISYPNNYVNTEDKLVAAYDKNDPTDVQDHTNNVPPTSLRNKGDGLHLNDKGYHIIAAADYEFIKKNGW